MLIFLAADSLRGILDFFGGNVSLVAGLGTFSMLSPCRRYDSSSLIFTIILGHPYLIPSDLLKIAEVKEASGSAPARAFGYLIRLQETVEGIE